MGMKLIIHSQTSTVAPFPLGMDKKFHLPLYDICYYLSMLGLKFIHVDKRAPGE